MTIDTCQSLGLYYFSMKFKCVYFRYCFKLLVNYTEHERGRSGCGPVEELLQARPVLLAAQIAQDRSAAETQPAPVPSRPASVGAGTSTQCAGRRHPPSAASHSAPRPGAGCEPTPRKRTRCVLEGAQHESDEFARTLRRYPAPPASPAPPRRSASAELLQRLVDYTARTSLTASYDSKHIRFLKQNDQNRGRHARPSSDTQTPARPPRGSRSHSPGDRSTHRPRGRWSGSARGAEVRYLREVTRCLRDVLTDTHRPQHELCPRMQSRYEHHRRHRHADGAGGRESAGSNNISNNYADNMDARGSKRGLREVTQTKNDISNVKNGKICCRCKKPHPCASKCRPSLGQDLEYQVTEQVLKWLQHLPVPADDTEANAKRRKDVAKQMAKNLAQAVRAGDVDRIKPVIVQYLQEMPIWFPGDDTVKKMFTNEIIDKLLMHMQRLVYHETLRGDINNWLKDLPLAGKSDDISKEDAVNNILRIMKDVTQKSDKSSLKGKIESILNKLPVAKDFDKKQMIGNIADNLVNKFINKESILSSNENKIKETSTASKPKEDSFTKLIKCFPKPLQDLLSKENYDHYELEATREQISSYLDSLLDTIDIRLNARTKEKLTHRFMNKIRKQCKRDGANDAILGKHMKPEKDLETATDSSDVADTTAQPQHVSDKYSAGNTDSSFPASSLRRRINNDVSHVLGRSNVISDYSGSTLEMNLTNIMADQIVRGATRGEAARELHSFLINCSVPAEQAELITVGLLERAREIPESDDNDADLTSGAAASGARRYGNKPSQRERKDSRSGVGSSPDRNITAHSASTVREHSNGLVERSWQNGGNNETFQKTQRLNFQASSPREDTRASYEQRDSFFGLNVSDIHLDGVAMFKNRKEKRNEQLTNEQKYTKELHDVIDSWVNDLPLNLDVTGGQNYKTTLIHDLVGDIVDRNKYLALNKRAKSSDEDDLEHLRYQVFRWLNKLVDARELPNIMAGTDQLISRLRHIAVPLFKQPSGARTLSKRTRAEIPHFKDVLEDEISVWMDEISPNILKTHNKSSRDNMVRALAEKVIQSDGSNIDSEVGRWLQDVLPDADADVVKKMRQSLRAMLESKGFTDKSHVLRQDTGQFIEENLSGAIMDWLNRQPFRSLRQQDAPLQEHVATELARAMARLFEETETERQDFDASLHFLEIIRKHLKLLPITIDQMANEEFFSKISQELLNHLQGLKLFQNLTSRYDYSLILSSGILKEQEHKLLQGYRTTKNNKSISEEKPYETNSNSIKMTSPLKASIGEQHDSVGSGFINRGGIKKTADMLYDSIVKACRDIPAHEVPTETKQEIANRLINKVGDLNMQPEIFNDDVLYRELLTEELEDVLEELQVKSSLNNFKQNVLGKINETRNQILNSMSGQTYRLNLKHILSTSLPSTNEMSHDERALFELLQDDLVDAFVNVRCASGNEQLRKKYKKDLTEKVTKFCNDYLSKFPASPIGSDRLNEDLYNALKSVALPEAGALKNEAEQTVIKEKLKGWISELPLEQQTPERQLRTNKIINILAKNLHDIEGNKPQLTDTETEQITKLEVMKWLKKLPMKPDRDKDIEDFTNRLIDKLKSNKPSRSSGPAAELSADDEWTDVSSSARQDSSTQTSRALRPAATASTSVQLPNTLTQEDQAHLSRIRERSKHLKSLHLKDAVVSAGAPEEESQASVVPKNTQRIENEAQPSTENEDKQNSKTMDEQSLTGRDSQISQYSKHLIDQITEVPHIAGNGYGESVHKDASSVGISQNNEGTNDSKINKPKCKNCGQYQRAFEIENRCHRPSYNEDNGRRGCGVAPGVRRREWLQGTEGSCESGRRRVLPSAEVSGRGWEAQHSLRRCPKCCGTRCPHPAYLYFR
ncbi:uncharacterized protein LOC101742877 isoform X3 [Bombyx mori]|uniref:uncharacterized protein LOC101742877 isoform X3 n=1 Tax=Bombyx mori TaxID=7091 RepID=UPI002ED1E51F